MTDRATFGDFLRPAQEVSQARGSGGRVTGRHDVVGVSQSLGHVVKTMSRYVDDGMASYPVLLSAKQSALTTWALAGSQAQEALRNAARFLPPQRGGVGSVPSPASELGRRLEAAAAWLTAGRDLLQTHVAVSADGTRQQRSEWAAVVTSPATRRALLAEIAAIARQIAPQTADLALSASAGGPGTAEARRRLNAACQWLWLLNSSVQAAQRREPVSTADREMLRAIPVNALPARRLPDGTESVTGLCEGAVTSAERVRQLAWGRAERAAWSRGMSVTSLHQVAATSTVTSHNCHVVLQTLAAGMAGRASDRFRTELTEAAEAAGHAREAWRRVAGAVDQIVTDGRGHVSPVAVEVRDLAIWTGRLAYAEPGWTPASGPGRAVRPPGSLMPVSEQVPLVVAAVHHATHTLTRLAWAQEEEIWAAAQAGRILVTTRSLSDDFDIPHPYTRAPCERVERLLSQYRDAGQASHRATGAVAEAAQTTRAPSRVLAAAMAAEAGHDRDDTGRFGENGQAPGAGEQETFDRVGPVERTLLDLGVTRPELLRRAAELDRGSERLIVEAAEDRDALSQGPDAVALKRSAGTAAVVNHALALGDLRAKALLCQPDSPGLEPPEPEA